MHRSLVLSLLLGLGCRRESVDESSTAPVAIATSPSNELRERVAALGDGAPLVLVIHPEHWGQARPHLSAMLAGHPDAKARAIGAATDANALLSALFDATKSSPPEDEPYGVREEGLWASSHAIDSIALAGWDLGRPIVMALGEPPVDGPPGTALAAYLGRMELEPQRHQVSIPATDDEVLVGALGRVLDELGAPAPELVEGHEGARAWRAGGDYVAVLPQQTSVRLVVLAGAFGEPTPARLAAWNARLEPTPASLPDTPTLALALAPEPLVAALVRPWRLRGWSTWNGFHDLTRALRVVSRDQFVSAMAMGGSVAMSAELVMSQRTADVDDWAFAVVADDTSLRLRAAASLAPSGRQSWDTAWADACGEAKDDAAAAGAPPFFDASRFPVLAAAQRHPGVGPQLAEIVQECGFACPMHLALTQPFGLLPPARCDLLEGKGDASVLPDQLLGSPAVATMVRSLRDVRWQTRRDGDALVNETVLVFGDAAPAVATSPGGGRWDSPLGAETVGTRDECLVEIIVGLREGTRGLARDEPSEAAKGAAWILAQLEPAFACASKDSEPGATARALRSAFVGLAARSLDDAYLGSSARLLLEESCREHDDAAACSRVEAMRARPQRVPLALVEPSDCDRDRLVPRGALTISVAVEGTWLGDTAYGTDLAVLERALVSARGDDVALSGVVVFAVPSLTVAQVQPTLEALARAGASEIGVVVSEAGAPPRILPLRLSERSRSPAAGEVEEAAPADDPGPPAKRGLYAMKGPTEMTPRMLGGGPTTVLHLGIDDVELRTPTGARIPLRGSTPAERRTALDEANAESGSFGLAVELGEATPWSRLGLALETSCDVELRPAGP